MTKYYKVRANYNEKAARGGRNVVFAEDDEDLLDKEGNKCRCIEKSPD